MVSPTILRIVKQMGKARDIVIEGVFRPEKFARRTRLATGLVKDVLTGTLSPQTRKDLIEEIVDAITETEWINPFLEPLRALERIRDL